MVCGMSPLFAGNFVLEFCCTELHLLSSIETFYILIWSKLEFPIFGFGGAVIQIWGFPPMTLGYASQPGNISLCLEENWLTIGRGKRVLLITEFIVCLNEVLVSVL